MVFNSHMLKLCYWLFIAVDIMLLLKKFDLPLDLT